ncbi:uncharacterized protein HMPREF1541_10439 [Cyphellophora europaea CBS 101466]|uniref:Transcription factor domain-containing protein n=1 Tax=Cyphellophora europaea (strain CBS 101466) TaxID=1220924 RepID=W2SA26_CYPE1|nr:uncharacterized protein HMPREF1541_10439 [Cyphellophora europaea CBS 101466]ETN44769.1 hypothetical protein HMPREF1541_10439 [Cyphellophora europaea CBS 101466]
MQVEEHKFTKQAQTQSYVSLPSFSISGALRAFYEWQHCQPEHDINLLYSSAAFSLMQITQEMFSEGSLYGEMQCLNEAINGQDATTSYSTALRNLIRSLSHGEHRSADETIARVVLLALQASISNFHGPEFWIHMRGLSGVVHDRGSCNLKTPKAQLLIRACRTGLLYTQMFDPQIPLAENRVWRHGLNIEAEYTDMDTLVGFMASISILMRRAAVCRSKQEGVCVTTEARQVVTQMTLWYAKAGDRISWSVCKQIGNNVKCPLDSFLSFANPVYAEICLLYHTILLAFADFMESRTGVVTFDLARCPPCFDAFTLAYNVTRMVPYFLAGGILGYFTVNFPVRFALRSFNRLEAVEYRQWLLNVIKTSRLASLDTRDFFSERPQC